MTEVSNISCSVPFVSSGRLCVLLVDDDEAFRSGLADNLRDDGHSVLAYAAPSEVPSSAFRAVSVVVTDFDLPGNDGLSFAEHVHAAQPSLPVVVVTAHPDAPAMVNAVARGFVRLMEKPVDYQSLHRLLHTLVDDGSRALS
ncbi:MAG TPA: response regulator [Candidatus Margulisiibacteriota bacterium]|nr:response regulator [Candidatus Margulisiibacteriota bacterium]